MWNDYLKQKKSILVDALHAFFLTQKQIIPSSMSWGSDVMTRLETTMIRGKMIRGTLSLLGYELCGRQTDNTVMSLAIAMEFFQEGLLIHDDIMDNDAQRRGMPSVHTQYTSLMDQQHSRYPKNTGKSLGICAGDAAFFLGYRSLANHPYTTDIYRLLDEELTFVTYAQMQDIATGASNRPVRTLDEILSMYRYKTGRYSITLPMLCGMTLGKATEETQKHIARFGDAIGIAFQLIDDRMDIFGDEKIIGKPVGSDIREGKQTPYIFLLRQKGSVEETDRIQQLFEKGSTTEEDMTWIRQTIEKYGVQRDIDTLIDTNVTIATEAIENLPIHDEHKQLFHSFADYLTKRVQ